jgi:hypothetical protein
VPRIIDYSIVLTTLEQSGLRCVYPNSGAFGLAADKTNHIAGWIAADDPTIRAELRAVVQIVPSPASRSLATLLLRAWRQHLPGPLWLMPASHWAYELQFGAADWLPALLADHCIDATVLQSRSDGSAIEFQLDETESPGALVEKLFDHLDASDFTAAFPGSPAVAMLHHHQQIWWQTSDRTLANFVRTQAAL